jgi:hypothetical protein
VSPLPKVFLEPGDFAVLTLTEPRATLVVLGEKEWETRGWPTSYRGAMLIQAAKAMPTWAQDSCLREPFESVLSSPHQSLVERPKAPRDGGLDSHTNLIVCDEYDDCYDDGSDDTGGDSGWPDNCTNLYIELYDETQTWHHDMDGYNTAVALANFYQCGTFDAYGRPVYPQTCAVLLVDVAGWALWVEEDIAYLNDTAYSLSAAGCTAH